MAEAENNGSITQYPWDDDPKAQKPRPAEIARPKKAVETVEQEGSAVDALPEELSSLIAREDHYLKPLPVEDKPFLRVGQVETEEENEPLPTTDADADPILQVPRSEVNAEMQTTSAAELPEVEVLSTESIILDDKTETGTEEPDLQPQPIPSAAPSRRAVTSSAKVSKKSSSETEDQQAFDIAGVQKMGVVGGKGVGKSYLFQAMVYRTLAGRQAGAMSHYLEKDAIRLFSARKLISRASTENLFHFIRRYRSWHRLPQTQYDSQRWYRLRLPYRTGILGRTRSHLDVEFFDGSGEGFFEAVMNASNRELWREGYLDARVIVFCLPIWIAFPSSSLSQEDWHFRESVLEGFERAVQNFTDLRVNNRRTHPVSTILTLTMADDRRSALKVLRDRWITPYMDSPQSYLVRLHKGKGVARYLNNARRISEALHNEFAMVSDLRIAGIPQKLDFNNGRPWLIPVSAIDGSLLEEIEQRYPDPDARPANLMPPVPVHVELPLLVALCERNNALL